MGDYELAQAFSRSLIDDFRIGRSEIRIPDTLPRRPYQVPSNFKAVAAPSGIVVTWDAVYGAYWYDLRVRLAGSDDWTVHYVATNRYDTAPCVSGQEWEYQVRMRCGDTVKSAWSDVVSAIAHPDTLPAPSHIITHATANGFRISWDSYPDGLEVDRYGVYAFDQDIPGSFPCGIGMRGDGGQMGGLVPGHHYGVAVQTWNRAGGGLLGGARAVTVGRGTPLPPMRLQLIVIDRTTAELRWRGDPAAAGFRVFVRRSLGLPTPADHREVYNATRTTNAQNERALLRDLLPSVWDLEYAVSGYNGNDESDVSQWIQAPPSLTENDMIRIELEISLQIGT